MYLEDVPLPLRLAGYDTDGMYFHPTMLNIGLLETPEAPLQFIEWLEGLLKDW